MNNSLDNTDRTGVAATAGDRRPAFADLIARLEKATGPDRELDADIALAAFRIQRGATIRKAHIVYGDRVNEGCLIRIVIDCGDTLRIFDVPKYTEDLQQSLYLWRALKPELVPSTPIANCIAALRTREISNDPR
jgi:hypothetical protein